MTLDNTAKELRERLDAATEAMYDAKDAFAYAEGFYASSTEYYRLCWKEWIAAKNEHEDALRAYVVYAEKGH